MPERVQEIRYSLRTESNSQQQRSHADFQQPSLTTGSPDQRPFSQQSSAQLTDVPSSSDLQPSPEVPGGAIQQLFQLDDQLQTVAAPGTPLVLSRAERQRYDQIFRTWDPLGEGFITGQMALELFTQSGLHRRDLAKIWALADKDNRGKLNLPEFHIAMGLISRRRNGGEIPDELDPEPVLPTNGFWVDPVSILTQNGSM